jgi:hypothetical protein
MGGGEKNFIRKKTLKRPKYKLSSNAVSPRRTDSLFPS